MKRDFVCFVAKREKRAFLFGKENAPARSRVGVAKPCAKSSSFGSAREEEEAAVITDVRAEEEEEEDEGASRWQR